MKRLYAALTLAILAALFCAPPAFAHVLNFESDMDENGTVSWCDGSGYKYSQMKDAAADWNTSLIDAGYRRMFVNVTGTTQYCELRVVHKGGSSAVYYAQVSFGCCQPDQLQISDRFNDLGTGKQNGTLRHELGHSIGLAHNGLCADSVMPTLQTCSSLGVPRRTTVGLHDIADVVDYWFSVPIYPIHDKCWFSLALDDANGDGLCDHYGPPPA